VTIATGGRQQRLIENPLAEALADCLKTACANDDAALLMYCLMPDHLHALIQVTETDHVSIIGNYKSFSTKIWWQHGGTRKLWQRSAYDRGIRQPEYMHDLLKYLFNNPAEVADIKHWIERDLLGGCLFEESE
jgi:REP element-mobilizing transposase RayT